MCIRDREFHACKRLIRFVVAQRGASWSQRAQNRKRNIPGIAEKRQSGPATNVVDLERPAKGAAGGL
eukprot:11968450-Alexandrium_andersonii.AAC.1